MDEPYSVEVLHIVNPHLIFVESQIQKGTPVIQQVGIFGVLPVNKTIDIDGKIIAERCENWSVAANTILREILAEYKNHVYFVPLHVDERSTIFDENVHQFGDIILKHRKTVSITDHLTELAVAIRDEPTFHQKLASGSLKLKLNTERIEEVLRAIEKYYKKQRKVGHDWQKTIAQQTYLHQESKKFTALTEQSLMLLERSSQMHDVKYIKKNIERKEKDLNLCKDVDLESVGCGSRRNKSNQALATLKQPNSDNEYKPHEMFSTLKDFLVKHGQQKDQNANKPKIKEIVKHSTPKQVFKKQTDVINKSMDSDDEWDDTDGAKISSKALKNVQHYSQGQEKSQRNLKQKQCKSAEQFYRGDHKEDNEEQQYYSEDKQCNNEEQQYCSEKQLMDLNYNKQKQRSDIDVLDKQNINLSKFEDKDFRHHASNNATSPLKPRKRHLVYCPDMEMNSTNLKNFVTITVPENSTANYADIIKEVQGKNTKSDNDQDSDLTLNIVENAFDDVTNVRSKTNYTQTDSQKSNLTMKAVGKVSTVSKTGLNMSILEKKLLALNSKTDVNVSISSNSDLGCNKKTADSVNVKRFESKNLETEKIIAPHSETKIRNKSKANRILSSSILEKKLQALRESKQRKENSGSTSDTSVKDTGSSTEQSKISLDEPDQLKIQPEPPIVEIQPKLAENVEKLNRNVNPFKNLDGSKSVFVEKLVSPILMVHTKNNNLVLPQCEIRDVPFKPDIKMMLKNMRIQKPKRLQMVSWGGILRGHSMFIIGPAGNGKTVGYVPAICNLVLDSPMKSEGVGPLCVIVCATALSVSEIESYCKRFLSVEERIVTFFPGIDLAKTTTSLLNGCHVLICTAPALLNLLETDFSVDLRRLGTLVLDDCERLAQVYTTEITRIIQNVKVALKNRADKALKVQYIVASRQWCDFMTPLAKKAPDTVIAIGASQECVLYSKTKTSVNIVKSQVSKVNSVTEFLEEIDRTKRTVIVCREDEEVTLLDNILKLQKHVVFSCNNTMDLHELCRLNEAWANYEEPILGPILICCDGNLTHLNITDANYLVHFSMPPLFSMFCKRFSVLNENYASIFGPEKEDVKIKILLDETNVEQLPKILNFVKRCTKEAFPNLDDVLQEVLVAKDLKKAENLNPICNNLLMLGECADMWNCSDRHTVFKEFDETKDWMPKHGVITFKITHYDSAVTYSARVLSKITKSGPVKYPNNYNTLSLKMGMHYSKEMNRKLHGIPKVGDICAVALKQNFFERCQVMKVIPTGTKNTNHVLINLIDEEQLTVISDVSLYYLPDNFKAIETHVVKVRLANIQPKDKDVTFSLAAKKHLQQMTDRETEQGLYIRGQVVMTLGNTIFVDTAEACVDLSSLGETVMKRDFKKELLDRHAEPNSQHIQKLKELKTAGGMVNTVDINEPNIETKVKKCPKWAYLDKDEFSTVILSAVIDAGTMFIRHAKFQKVVELLLKDIKEYVEKAPDIEQEEVYVGNFVLGEFPDDATYERARIDDIVCGEIVNCFFVDNGDWRQVAVNKLKPITNNIMHRIPFQAIECRLVGLKPPGDAGTWPEFSTCWLDDNCFEDKDCNQKQLFAKYFTKEKATVTGGYKYGVVVIDTYSEQDVVINKIMIELNLAKVLEDEEKYIDEPLDLQRLKALDSSSDSDEFILEKDNITMDNDAMPIKDLVPLQPKEIDNTPSNDIPLHILLGKPIRSVPLVDSDNESDLSDKWDVNVDKDLLGMFSQPSKANISEHKDTTNENNDKTQMKTNIASISTNKSNDMLSEKTNTLNEVNANNDINAKNEIKDSSMNIIVSSNSKQENINLESQPMSPSLDSDDIDISDEKLNVKTLNVFRSKLFKKYGTEDLNKPKKEMVEKTKNDTLDSDDLSEVTNTSVAKITETIDPPRKPKLVWRQNKNTVAMKIILIGADNYNLEIKERGIKFKTWHNDTNYEFEFELYGVIVPENSVHSNKGQYILVRLVKMLSRSWLSLTKDFSIKKWIVYDVDALEFSSDEEEGDDEARKVIKYNHEKAESSSEDEDFADDMDFKYKRH